jgi:hypothetical protein
MSRQESFKSSAGTSAALAVAARANPLLSSDLQELWFSLLRQRWSTLVVMPAHRGGSSLELTQSLADVGRAHRGSRPMVIDARTSELGQAAAHITEMTTHASNGGLVLVAASAVLENQVGIPLALAASAVLLTVTLGETDMPSLERTLELVGRQRVLGCVTLPRAR